MDVKKIKEICKKYKIENYTINDDGSVDVDGNVNLSTGDLKEIPLNFNKVSGSFWVDGNGITSLKGSPKKVGGRFDCSMNNLTSLEGGPKIVDRFVCSNNNLTDLKGGPKSMSKKLYCTGNPIGSILNGVDIEFIIAFNSFRILIDGVVYLKRLKYLMSLFGNPINININKIKKHYTIK
tara:strand:- start:29 stop:565 length:537 start_codon:yes stop_codon:yes gene_type:complete